MRLIIGQAQMVVAPWYASHKWPGSNYCDSPKFPWDANSEGDVQMSELFEDMLESMNEFIEYEKQEDCESDRIKLRVTEIEVDS